MNIAELAHLKIVTNYFRWVSFLIFLRFKLCLPHFVKVLEEGPSSDSKGLTDFRRCIIGTFIQDSCLAQKFGISFGPPSCFPSRTGGRPTRCGSLRLQLAFHLVDRAHYRVRKAVIHSGGWKSSTCFW